MFLFSHDTLALSQLVTAGAFEPYSLLLRNFVPDRKSAGIFKSILECKHEGVATHVFQIDLGK